MEGTTIRRDGESNRIAAGGTAGEWEEGLEGKDLGFLRFEDWGDLKLEPPGDFFLFYFNISYYYPEIVQK